MANQLRSLLESLAKEKDDRRAAQRPADKGAAAATSDVATLLEDFKNEIATLYGSVFFGMKGSVKKFDTLKSKLSQDSIFTRFFTEMQKSVKTLNSEKSPIINAVKTSLGDISENIENIIAIQEKEEKGGEKGKGATGSVEMVVKGIDKDGFKALEEIAKADSSKSLFGKDSKFLDEEGKAFESLEKSFNNINKLDAETLKKATAGLQEGLGNLGNVMTGAGAVGVAAQGVPSAMKSVEKAAAAIQSAADSLAQISESIKDLGEGLDHLGDFIMKMAIIMGIGAVFMFIPGLADNALLFGQVLTKFIITLLVPITIISIFADPDVFVSLQNVGKFITICAIVMSIGALFMMIPGFADNALEFGKILTKFIVTLLLPLALISLFTFGFDGIVQVGKFVMIAAIVMTIGALFVMLGGGKFIKASLQFGKTLSDFILSVILPVILFAPLVFLAMAGLDNIGTFVVECAAVMCIGALFVMLGGGKFVKAALQFGIVLGLFILCIMLPIALSVMLAPLVVLAFFTINAIRKLILTCVLTMIIGALFVMLGGGKFIKSALIFTGLLFLFVVAVMLPVIVFSIVFSKLNLSFFLLQLTLFVISLTLVLLIGAYFMSDTKMAKGAIWFTVYSVLYTMSMFLLFKWIAKSMTLSKEAMLGVAVFEAFVAIMAATMTLGPVLLKLAGCDYGDVGLFTLNLTIFIIAMGVAMTMVMTMMSLVKGGGILQLPWSKNSGILFGETVMGPKEILDFAFIVAILGATMTLGPAILKVFDVGFGDIFSFTANLAIFVIEMGAIFTGIIALMNLVTGDKKLGSLSFLSSGATSLVNGSTQSHSNPLMDFAITVGLLSISMTLGTVIMTQFGITFADTFEFTGNLTIFVGLMGIVFALIVKIMDNAVSKTSDGGAGALKFLSGSPIAGGGMMNNPIMQFAILVGLMSVTMLLGTWMMNKFGIKFLDCIAFAIDLGVYIGLMSVVVKQVNKIKLKDLVWGGLVMVALSGLLMITGYGIKTFYDLMQPIEFGALMADLGSMALVIGLMGVFVVAVGFLVNIPIVAWLLLVGSLTVIAICELLILTATAISEFYNAMEQVKFENVMTDLEHMAEIMKAMSATVVEIGAICCFPPILLFLAVGAFTLRKLCSLIVDISTDLMIAVLELRIIADTKFTDNDKNHIVSIISTFLDIANACPDMLTFLVLEAKIGLMMSLARPLAYIIKIMGEAIKDMAEGNIATAWDKNGNAIKWRSLRKSDFDNAGKNTGDVIMCLANALVNAWEGNDNQRGLKEFYDEGDGDSTLCRVLWASMQMGKVIGSIGDGISKMATLMIPTKWNEEGTAIEYRTLKKKDFKLAADGVSLILTTLAQAIVDTYQIGKLPGNNGVNIFDDIEGGLWSSDKPSIFKRVLTASLQLGELIGNIGEAVGKVSQLQVPIDWDPKTGKVTNYRTLNKSDFKRVGKSVATIMTTLAQAVLDCYDIGDDLGDGQNIFDEVNGGWFHKDKPSPFSKVMAGCLQMAELIGNIGEGVAKMATLMVPDDWDHESGKAIHYKQISQEDLSKVGPTVQSIVTCLANAIIDVYVKKPALFDVDEDSEDTPFNRVVTGVNNMTKGVSDIADILAKLAVLQVPDEWDPKTGKPIHYKEVDITTIATGLKDNLPALISTIVDAFTAVANDQNLAPLFGIEFDKETDDANNAIFKAKCTEGDAENNPIMRVITGVTGMVGVVSSMVDILIKMGQALVPCEWTDDGKPKKYKEINFVEAQAKLENVIHDTLGIIVGAFKQVYTDEEFRPLWDAMEQDDNGIFSFKMSDEDDNPVIKVVTGVTAMVNCVGQIVDMILKVAQCLIPDDWTDDGKPKHYKEVNLAEASAKIQSMLPDLINSIVGSINAAAPNFTEEQNEKYQEVSTGVTSLTNIINTIMGSVVKISEGKIVTGYDKEGKATGYTIMKISDIINAESLMDQLITTMSTIATTLFAETVLVEDKSDICDAIVNNLEAMGEVIAAIIENVIDFGGADGLEDITALYNQGKLGGLDGNKNNLAHIFVDTIEAVKAIAESALKIYSDTNDDGTTNLLMVSGKGAFAELLNNQLHKQLKQTIKTVIDTLETLMDAASDINDIFDENQAGIEFVATKLDVNMINKVIANIKAIAMILGTCSFEPTEEEINEDRRSNFGTFGKIAYDIGNGIAEGVGINALGRGIKKLMQKPLKERLKDFKASIHDITMALNTLGTSTTSIANSIGIISKSYGRLQSGTGSLLPITFGVKLVLRDLRMCVIELSSSYDTLVALYGPNPLKNKLGTMLLDIKDAMSTFSILSEVFNVDIMETSKFVNAFGKSLFNLGSGLIQMNKAIQSSKYNPNFEKNVKRIKTFIVDTVNKVDLKRIDKLISLTQAMIRLADKTTNLDKLTNAIANELTDSLTHLSKKLDESKTTILLAEKIQTERHKKIDASIKQINTIMSKEIQVKVTAEGSGMATDTGGMATTGTDNTNNSPDSANANVLSSTPSTSTSGTSGSSTSTSTNNSNGGSGGAGETGEYTSDKSITYLTELVERAIVLLEKKNKK